MTRAGIIFGAALMLSPISASGEIRPTMRPVAAALQLAPMPAVLTTEIVVTGTPLAPERSSRPVMRASGQRGQGLEFLGVVRAALDAAEPDLGSTRAAPSVIEVAETGLAVARSARPTQRPARAPRVAAATGGSVCNSPSIQGQRLAPIAGRIAGCGVEDPVSVTTVAGVTLSTAATMDCGTAEALETWVREGVIPTVGRTGGGVSGLQVAAHYACRTRNNQAGARISEHGKGRAIDISAIILADGTRITLLEGWNGPRRHRRILRALHTAACGPFGTVLGPESDRHHQDHFHFDTARYRSGSYCR